MKRRYFLKSLGASGTVLWAEPLGPIFVDGEPRRQKTTVTHKFPDAPETAPYSRQLAFPEIEHNTDLCVVGGGMAGLCAAVAAARRGAQVVLIQDRAVLGGNASSEIRMHIGGAHGADNKETGILEEALLENLYRNPGLKYAIWDTVLFEKAYLQENLTLLLNCSCFEVRAADGRIESVKGWQTTTQQFHRVDARFFADCSGDSVLRVCGAEYRVGRESRHEFGESHAPQVADRKTMGNSILIQLCEVGEHIPFVPPQWAHVYQDGDLPNRPLHPEGHNFWWLEIGGEQDTIADAEDIRDELYKIAFGVWAYIKNHPDGRARNWELDWIGALPGKRENIRYVGDHILTQNDIEAEGRFADLVAYGGWSMDDHHPAAIEHKGEPTIFHPAPSPYGIPYRALYSRNIENLFFAGRNVSASHMAMSSTRVMATCAIIGQAVGTAAALAVRHGLSPRGIYEHRMGELQEVLMDDDCYLPWHMRTISALTRDATLTASSGDPEPLRDGIDRNLGEVEHGWWADPDAFVECRFGGRQVVQSVRLVFDSDQGDTKRMPFIHPKDGHRHGVPDHICADFDLAVLGAGDNWETVKEVRGNYQRLVKLPLTGETKGVRFVARRAWGGRRAHLLAFDVC